MSRKVGNTVRRAVRQMPKRKQAHLQGRNLSQKQHRAERDFRICLHIANALRANGLLTDTELVRVRKRLIKKYDPVIGGLLDRVVNR